MKSDFKKTELRKISFFDRSLQLAIYARLPFII